jgi:rhomboid protease GluP
MDAPNARIPARSRRQAMDWSLVLVSQGIQPTIESGDSLAGWGLLVAEAEYIKAIEAIRLYESENRGWLGRLKGFRTELLFDWGALAWVAILILFYWADTRVDLQPIGIMDASAVSRGEWWRCFTAIWLHADLAHLAGNATLGVVLLGLTMARYGTGPGMLMGYLTGAGANVAVWLVSPKPRWSLGASGLVMGCLGLLAIQTVWRAHHAPSALKYLLSGVFGAVMLFVLLGLGPGTDVATHAAGFINGLALGACASFVPRLAQKRTLSVLSGFGFVLLTLWPWWLALHHR